MRILCLDDEPLALKLLVTMIEKVKPDAEAESFRIQTELLEAAEKNGCDVAFLDIHMRGMNGVEVAKKLKGLREAGAEEVIIRKRDEMAVNPALLDCDYYRFAELDVGAVNAYANEYMSQYYWAEFMINEYE